MMSFLRERTREGFQQRYGRATADLRNRARQQVERELKLIEHLKLEGYFLIVWDLVRFCREQNILVQGRGSADNTAACYSLGITAIDRVGMDLLFERFLSEERGEWPDIDLDLPSGDQRERVIQYLYKRYGERGAAMTANVITYRSRMAGREMGKRSVSIPKPWTKFPPRFLPGNIAIQTTLSIIVFAMPGLISITLACANILSCAWQCRICLGISASIQVAWSFARGSSILLFRSNLLPCRGALSCSGIKMSARISALLR